MQQQINQLTKGNNKMSNAKNIIARAIATRVEKLQNAQIADSAKASQIKQLMPLLKVADDKRVKHARELMTDTDFNEVAKIIASCDEHGKGIEQVKTIVKIIDVIKNVSQGLSAKSNNFNCCINAMLHNGNTASRSELVIAQSAKAREGLAGKVREGFNVRSSSYSIGTGDSQASQVLQVLRVLGFATYNKGEREGVATMKEYGYSMLSRAYLKLETE